MLKKDDHWSFPYCPTSPDFQLDWTAITDRFHWISHQKNYQPEYNDHTESDQLTNTQRVCESLIALPEWQQLSITARSILFAGALLQNVTKPGHSVIVDEDTISSPGQVRNNARLARDVLWQMNPIVPFHYREMIVALVRHASLPFYLIERRDPVRAVITASITSRCDWLSLLAEANAGSHNIDKQSELLEKIELFRDYCREQSCYTQPHQFASPQSRFIYFHKENSDPDYQAFDDTKFEVVMMSGLPASGKDYYIKNSLAGWPVISLDAIRLELKVPAHKNQGVVVTQAKSRAREYLRIQRSFVWNATNITRPMREQLIDLFTSYRARVRIVYCEAGYDEILRRNHAREMTVPRAVINRMADRLDIPDLTEAQLVDYEIS